MANHLLSPASAMFREGNVLLHEQHDLGDVALYYSVLTAISRGAHKRSEIAGVLVLLGTFYAAMAGAGYLVEILFRAAGLVPRERAARVMTEGISWNYTTWLNVVFLILAAVFLVRFLRTGGLAMLRMMGGSPQAAAHDHGGAPS